MHTHGLRYRPSPLPRPSLTLLQWGQSRVCCS